MYVHMSLTTTDALCLYSIIESFLYTHCDYSYCDYLETLHARIHACLPTYLLK